MFTDQSEGNVSQDHTQDATLAPAWTMDARQSSSYGARGLEEDPATESDVTLTSNAYGLIEDLNAVGESIFGYHSMQLVGMPLYNLFAASYARNADARFTTFLRNNRLLPLGKSHTAIGVRADGRPFPMEILMTPSRKGGRAVFAVALRDLSPWLQQRAHHEMTDVNLEHQVHTRTAALQEVNEQLQATVLEQAETIRHREALIADLTQALLDVRTLTGILPICASCKQIRHQGDAWTSLEHYICTHSNATFSHGLCPDCITHLYSKTPQQDPEDSHAN